jgi:beta-glucanase (GH16 family)
MKVKRNAKLALVVTLASLTSMVVPGCGSSVSEDTTAISQSETQDVEAVSEPERSKSVAKTQKKSEKQTVVEEESEVSTDENVIKITPVVSNDKTTQETQSDNETSDNKTSDNKTSDNKTSDNKTGSSQTSSSSSSGSSNNSNNNSNNNNSNNNNQNNNNNKDDKVKDGYTLVWEDNFDGTSLNLDDWNVEAHEPGWVNAELQKYVDANENEETGNITVSDGVLTIKPIKTVDEDGTVSYTSGRINTQGKHDYTYGYFEVRAKVTEGKGYLPAFWMMPTDENIYGQWPRCGEIDIMEVMGQETNKVYGTIHYGNPHDQSQGTNVLSTGDFSSEYHTYAVDWEPGKITWYVDGVKYHEERDWYSTTVGQGTVSYPAPFDQPFYMILNLAVGGEWVGYPDETTDFENQAFVIDYVRAYQRTDGYSEEGVKRPDKADVELREPDETGNYVFNGDFSEDDDFSGEGGSRWQFMTALGGEATIEIVDNSKFADASKTRDAETRAVKIATTNAGTVDYSVQFVQAAIPVDNGNVYTVTFDAYADEARTMIVDVSAPDHNYTRYLADTTVELTTDIQTYTYTFNMDSDKDANGRLEFNLGNTSSTATVYISNVRIENTDTFEIDESKQPLTDGNYVYNGSFQEGTSHMEYWTVSGQASYGVTSLSDGRRFKITTTDCDNISDVTLKQTELPLAENSDYSFSFEAALDADATQDTRKIKVSVAGNDQTFTISKNKKTYTYTFKTGDTLSNKDIVFNLGINDTVYIDNVRVDEDSLIKNGSFNAGLSGYEVYAYTESDVSYTVDSLSEDNAFDITIKDTNDAEWKIQLKQDNVTLEKDQWYKLSFDAKSSVERKIQYAIQRDGSDHKDASGNEDWTPYVQDIVTLNSKYQTISKVFQMTEDTDAESIFNIALGKVGERITAQHRVCIDNISLEKVDAPEQEEAPEQKPEAVEGNMLINADFADGINGWTETIANWGGDYVADASRSIEDGNIIYDIKNPGTEDWHVQLKQQGLNLEKDATYSVKFDIVSTVGRTFKTGVMSTDYNYWYGGADIKLDADSAKNVEFKFTMKTDDSAADFYISLGKYTYEETSGSVITISNISFVKVSSGEGEPEDANLIELDNEELVEELDAEELDADKADEEDTDADKAEAEDTEADNTEAEEPKSDEDSKDKIDNTGDNIIGTDVINTEDGKTNDNIEPEED